MGHSYTTTTGLHTWGGGGGEAGDLPPPPPNLQTYTSGWIMIEVALQKLMFMVAKISV